jgi:RNA polymerase-binding protein DksA
MQVTAEELERLRANLTAERNRLMGELGYMEKRNLRNSPRDASGDLSGYSIHLADAGTDAAEREKAVQLTSAEGRLLIAISDALDRIEAGTYGVCDSCGGEIGAKRLEAMPAATQCIACKERKERDSQVNA